ncbi:MAG: hypothetical protein R3D55_23375 [Chloroflexota bacterium]
MPNDWREGDTAVFPSNKRWWSLQLPVFTTPPWRWTPWTPATFPDTARGSLAWASPRVQLACRTGRHGAQPRLKLEVKGEGWVRGGGGEHGIGQGDVQVTPPQMPTSSRRRPTVAR